MPNHFKEMLLQCNSGANLNGMRFWFTAENPLPLSLLQGAGSETSTYALDYDLIDDLLLCVQIIPFNKEVYRIFHLGAFLPVWLIREIMPELSMNGCNLTFQNKLYYRFDGKNANGKVTPNLLPMGGGGYGSYNNATIANRINAAWLLNYESPIPQDDVSAASYTRGWHYQNGIFNEWAQSAIGYITDLNLPNSVIANAVIYQNRRDYMEYIATTYDLNWWDMALQTQYSRIKDATIRQRVLDNLLITCNVSSQNSYNSGYRTYNITPQFYAVSPLNMGAIRGWLQRIGNSADTGNFFGFYGKLPAYCHFKLTTSNCYDSANNIQRMLADFENGAHHEWDVMEGNVDRTVLYKYMSNKITGWTGANDDVKPNLNSEYILRGAYSKPMQQVTGDINFQSAITCPDTYAAGGMVNLQTAQKQIHDVPILNFEYPGVIE